MNEYQQARNVLKHMKLETSSGEIIRWKSISYLEDMEEELIQLGEQVEKTVAEAGVNLLLKDDDDSGQ